MAYKVFWSEHALENVKGIIQCIYVTLANPLAAKEHLDAFEQAVKNIALFPNAKAISKISSLKKRDLRVYPVRNYLLLYRIQNEDTVIISRVFHSTQDYARIISQNTD